MYKTINLLHVYSDIIDKFFLDDLRPPTKDRGQPMTSRQTGCCTCACAEIIEEQYNILGCDTKNIKDKKSIILNIYKPSEGLLSVVSHAYINHTTTMSEWCRVCHYQNHCLYITWTPP